MPYIAISPFVKNPDDGEAIHGVCERYSDIIFIDVEMLKKYGLWNGFVKYSDGGTGEVQGARFKVKGERIKNFHPLPPPAGDKKTD